MLITADHRPWILATVAVTVVAAAGYAVYAGASAYGPSGGSWPGLAFGTAGTLAMIAAGLLPARKRLVVRRLGAARTWMKVHIWLGLLAVPLIWFHSGFRWGGALTTILMILFYVVIVSGIVGLALQQVVPAAMTRQVPLETVHSQIDHVLAGLAAEAYVLVAAVAGDMPEAAEERALLTREVDAQQAGATSWKQTTREPVAEAPAAGVEPLRALYLEGVRPYLAASAALPDLGALRAAVPEAWSDRAERLRAICEEARQLRLQRRLHAWLHGWLFVHAPISFALFVLVAIHIVYALRY